MHEQEKELVGLLARQCTNMKDVQQLLKSLFKETLEQMLEAEMDEHLGYLMLNLTTIIVRVYPYLLLSEVITKNLGVES